MTLQNTTGRVPIPFASASHRVPDFPGYALERELGRRGMGSVYLATQRDGRHVAIKTMHPRTAPNRTAIAFFSCDCAALRLIPL